MAINTDQYRLTEVNSHEDHPEAFNDSQAIARVFDQINDSSDKINRIREFLGNDNVRAVIPTVADELSDLYNNLVVNAEVASQTQNVEVSSPTLSPEALAYLRDNAGAAKVHSLNQVILDENHAIRENALDEDTLNDIEYEVNKVYDLLVQAENIYESVVNFGVVDSYDEDDDDDDDEWDDWYEDDEDNRWF